MSEIELTDNRDVREKGKEGTVVVGSPYFRHTWRTLTIFFIFCLLAFMSSIDSTLIITSLPTITREIGGSNQYVWISNSYLFASTVPQPFYGQIANIFGRRCQGVWSE